MENQSMTSNQIDQLINTANQLIFQNKQKHLDYREKAILKQLLEGKSPSEIVIGSYKIGTIQNFWSDLQKELSDTVGTRINSKTLKLVLKAEQEKINQQQGAAMQNPNIIHNNNLDFNDIVKKSKTKIYRYLSERHNSIRVIDTPKPISLIDIYTEGIFLETILAQKRVLNKENIPISETINLFLEEEIKSVQEILNKSSKLILLGKIGAGKTTFIKYLALQSASEEGFYKNHIPIFISLKDFVRQSNGTTSLQDFIADKLYQINIAKDQFKTLLEFSKKTSENNNINFLFLFDGLDEVKESYNDFIYNQIYDFYDKNFNNAFIITSRIGAKKFTFTHFTDVQIADFRQEQISLFTHKWFSQDRNKADIFIEKLEQSYSLRQLANNPLLLSQLCTVFQETGDFPSNISELYKEFIDILFKKLDESRNTNHGSSVYPQLRLEEKDDLLSQIAFNYLDKEAYLFEERELEIDIQEYVKKLSRPIEYHRVNSINILRSIEADHGILERKAKNLYSFSCRSFQEYFAAKKLASDFNKKVKNTNKKLFISPEMFQRKLEIYIHKEYWSETLKFTSGILIGTKADNLLVLIKNSIAVLK